MPFPGIGKEKKRMTDNKNKTGNVRKALQFDVKTLVTMAILIAMQIVISRFLSIQAWNLRIGFGFVPIVISAIMYGAVKTGIVAGVSDILGAVLFSIGFNPFLTVTAVLMGVIFGLFLHKKQTVVTVVLSVLVVQIICSLGLNSYILYIFYSSPETSFLAYLLTRIGQTLVMIPLEIAGILALGKLLLPKLHLTSVKS